MFNFHLNPPLYSQSCSDAIPFYCLCFIMQLCYLIRLYMFYGHSYPRICMMNTKISHSLGFASTIMTYVPISLTCYTSKLEFDFLLIFFFLSLVNSFVLMMWMTPQHTLFHLMKQKHAIWYPLQPGFIFLHSCVCVHWFVC